MDKIRVLIAEDERLLRETLAELLAREPDLQIVAKAGNGRDALIDALAHQPEQRHRARREERHGPSH